jgi:hypothetical protein
LIDWISLKTVVPWRKIMDAASTCVQALSSRVRWGHARADITPPVGIYHRLWGAAKHDRATGVHKPLLGDVVAIGPVGDAAPRLLRAHLDLVYLPEDQHALLRSALSQASGVPMEHTIVSYSHTHSSGWLGPDRYELPGGDMIPGYLADMRANLQHAAQEAAANVQETNITYATGRCNMAANRDYWDVENGHYVCGLNPEAPADDTVLVARVTDLSGDLVAVVVNYACHATSLSYENSLISPDYVGAMREEVTRVTKIPCIFALGPCGDLGPRRGYVGGPSVADQNGRWLAYAALSALESMGPPATDYQYEGPVVSGATLGIWRDSAFADERKKQVSCFGGGIYTVELPLKPRPEPDAVRKEMDQWQAREKEAEETGDQVAARDFRARAERARRWLARLAVLPEGATYHYGFSVYRLGDAFWVTCGGEPYNLLQTELRGRFPDKAILVGPVSGDPPVAYLLPRDRYGKGLYQEEPSILAPGGLEQVIDSITEQIAALL